MTRVRTPREATWPSRHRDRLSVERSNTVAISLYRSVGFEKTVDRMELEMELELGDESETDGTT